MKKIIKPILQLTSTECGICCVAMISQYYGKIKPLGYYRKFIQCGRDGAKVKEVILALQTLGIRTGIMPFSRDKCCEQKTPFLVVIDNKHFVVAENYKKHSIRIYDPAIGKIIMGLDEFERRVGNYIITTEETSLFVKDKDYLAEWHEFLKILLSEKKLLIFVFLASLIVYIGIITIPIVIQYFIDTLLVNNQIEFSGRAIFFSCIVVLLYFAVSFLKNTISVSLETRIDNKFLFSVIDKMLKLPYSFYEVRPSGDLISRLNLLNGIKSLVSSIIVAILNFVGVLFAIAYSFSLSVQMSAIAMVILGLMIVLVVIMNMKIVDLNYYELSELMDLNMAEAEFVNSIFDIKSLNFEEQFRMKIEKYYYKYAVRFSRRNWVYKTYELFLQFFQLFIPFFLLIFNLISIKNSSYTLGQVIGFYSISSMLISNTIAFIEKCTEISMAKNTLSRVTEILMEKELIYGDKELCSFEKLDVKNVIFSYTQTSDEILKGINISINKGEKIAIVGASGSGKSTLVKLLLGMYQPNSGEILYNSSNIHLFDRKEFAKKVGVVTQDVVLFNNTIRENIVMNRGEVSREELYKVLENVGILEEIKKMPMKENTLVSEFGRNISGGQRQRLAMARTLFNEPELLILDEATSSLDGLKEEEVVRFLDKINCAQIIISHRLSTIKKADYIYVLKDGLVIEEGNLDDLSKRGTYFSYMFKNQIEEMQ